MMSSMKFWLKLSPEYRLLTGNSMVYRQVPILIRLPSPVWWLNKIVSLLLLLRNFFPVRKNKTSLSLIVTFHCFSTPGIMSIWINYFTTPLSNLSKILIQLYMISCSIFRFSSHWLYFTSLKISWSILDVSLFGNDTINSFIVSSLKSFKF